MSYGYAAETDFLRLLADGHDHGGILQKLFGKKEAAHHDDGKGPLETRPGASVKAGLPEWNNQSGKSPYPMYIKYKGMIDFESLYKYMILWLKDRRYEVHEDLYKFKPPELEIRWLAERKKTGFAKELIHVHFHIWGEHDVEVVRNGKKKKMVDGRMVITLNIELEAPYEDPFGAKTWNLPMERKLLDLFHRYVLKNEFDLMYFDVLYYELYQFHTGIKKKLKLHTGYSAYGG